MNADNDGIYTAPNLVAGTYQISASKEGFATLVRSGVLVTVTTNNTSLFGANGTPISSAGVLTSTTTTSRQIQFGLKLIW